MLRLALLGTPEITLQGRSLLDQLAGRGLALVVYLAVTGQPHPRARLADLLWHDVSSEEALKRLRNLLPRVRPWLVTHLQITRDSLAFDKGTSHWLDVDVLRAQLSATTAPSEPQMLENALRLYRSDFLANLALRDAPVFEEWVIQQREDLHRLVIQGFHRLANCYLASGNYQAGLTATQRILALEPWREEAHRQQMLLLAKQGERTAALTQFHLCQRVLADEFGVEPTAETVRLYEQLRSNAFDKSSATRQPSALLVTGPAAQSQPVNWDEIPRPLRFYGREGELETLEQWINQERCRLVGIFGLAGQGKSTLMAHWLRTHYAAHTAASTLLDPAPQAEAAFDHILWCPLSSSLPLATLLPEWLLALSDGQATTLPARLEQQLALLLAYLRQQRCLVVLDNLEQVLPTRLVDDLATGRPAGYTDLLHLLATGDHQSCLVVISQQRPAAFTRWEEHTPAIRSLHLQGLSEAASLQLLSLYGLSRPGCDSLIQRNAGYPLALLVAAETTQELFAANPESLLKTDVGISAALHTLFHQQFSELGAAEQTILLWLALAQIPLPFEVLCARLPMGLNQRVCLEACRFLYHCLLIEASPEGFSLPPVLQAFLTDYLVEGISQELLAPQLPTAQDANLLDRYRLLDPEAAQPIQERQSQRLLQPILASLLGHWGLADLTSQLQAKLKAWLALEPRSAGYAQVNLRLLLLQLEGSPLAQQKAAESWTMTTSTLGVPSLQVSTAPSAQLTWLVTANHLAAL